jgi:ankyrin repeat protein
MSQPFTIDRLLNLVPDSPDTVIAHLRDHPNLASQQDSHGYSLLHAATSYGHIQLAQLLIKDFAVPANIADEDDETALFNAETVEMAKELLVLGVSIDARNSEGQTAAEKLDDEDEQPAVAAFLRQAAGGASVDEAASVVAQTGGAADSSAALNGTNGTDGVHAPPPLPGNFEVNVGTMDASEAGEEPNPEIRRRIEELAARPDFQTEQGQAELRELVSEILTGYGKERFGYERMLVVHSL